jgi:hypothetical protein
MIRDSSAAASEALTPMLALFNSLHTMVIWLVIFWNVPWGLGFMRLGGRWKMAGVFFCLNAAFLVVDYLLLRLGQTGLVVDLWHLGSQLMLLGALSVLGVLLVEASSAAGTSSS